MSVAAVCKFVLSLLGALLSKDQRQWAEAIRAEVDIPITAREKIALTVSGVFGLLVLAIRSVFLRWSLHPRALATVTAYGLVVGSIDANSSSRWPLRILVVCGALAFGIARPGVAALAGALMGFSIAWVARASGSLGPYAHDPGDVWIPLVPAIFIAVVGGTLGKLLGRLRSERSDQAFLEPG